MLNGKEAGTLMTAQSQQGVGYTDVTGWKFWFNRDGVRRGGWVSYFGTPRNRDPTSISASRPPGSAAPSGSA